jgi:hypothetical protein
MLKEDHHNVITCFFCALEHHFSDKKDHFPENKIISKVISFYLGDSEAFKFKHPILKLFKKI